MAYEIEPALRDWLLDTDPALRWQVERDLLDAPEEVWAATRARVATEGFGARAACRTRTPTGSGPAAPSSRPTSRSTVPRRPRAPVSRGPRPPGVSTACGSGVWTRPCWRGRPRRSRRTAAGSTTTCPTGAARSTACINAFTLANGAWLGADVSALARWFPEHRLPDGGWNCEWVEGSTRSSFHSTLNTIKGLLWYERHTGGDDSLRAARRAGRGVPAGTPADVPPDHRRARRSRG